MKLVQNKILISFRQKYNEFVLCIRKNNGDETPCNVKRQQALSICPLEWVSSLLLLFESPSDLSIFRSKTGMVKDRREISSVFKNMAKLPLTMEVISIK